MTPNNVMETKRSEGLDILAEIMDDLTQSFEDRLRAAVMILAEGSTHSDNAYQFLRNNAREGTTSQRIDAARVLVDYERYRRSYS